MKLLLLLVLQSTGGQLPATVGRRRHKRPPPKRQNPYSKAEWDRRKRQAGRRPPPLPPPSAPCDTSKLAYGVTIVTTATRDRLWNLKSVCERWRGPLVVAVGAADTDASSEAVATDAIAACDTTLSAVVMMPIHARDQLPVNQMRNRAWARARTSHVFVLDADFWPGSETYAAVQAALRVLQEDDLALVVPTFALEGRDGARAPAGKKIRATGHASLASLVPRTRDGLLRCIAAKDESFSHDWRGEGQLYWDTVPTTSSAPPIPPAQIRCEPFHHHGSTRFDAWMGASAPQRLQCFLGNFYEPFVVVRRGVRDTPSARRRAYSMAWGRRSVRDSPVDVAGPQLCADAPLRRALFGLRQEQARVDHLLTGGGPCLLHGPPGLRRARAAYYIGGAPPVGLAHGGHSAEARGRRHVLRVAVCEGVVCRFH